jgi:hypothetical protein
MPVWIKVKRLGKLLPQITLPIYETGLFALAYRPQTDIFSGKGTEG